MTYQSALRVQLKNELLELCSGDENKETIDNLLSEPTVTRLTDVARRYYCTHDGLPHPTIQGLSDPWGFRTELLHRAPAAVLAAVVDQGRLGIETTLQQQVAAVLSYAIESEFDLRNASLGKLIISPEYERRIKPADSGAVRKLLETLQRLQNLVVDAEDIRYLLGTPYVSAASIASVSYNSFIDAMMERGMPDDRIPALYNEASKIQRRNEQLWIDIVEARTQVPVLALSSQDTDTDTADTKDVNLTNLFNDIDVVETDDSTSVLSPAAYLVDLLQFLKKSQDNALQVLTLRRPDIQHIELSQENTQLPIAYSDLAIEVMEAHVARLSAQQPTSNAEQAATIAQLSRNIYKDAIGNQSAPMTWFPYNDAIHCTREILKGRGTTRHELLRLFSNASQSQLQSDVHTRRLAAEKLGLQPADFVAITQEGYETRQWIQDQRARGVVFTKQTYESVVGSLPCAALWGYNSDKAGATATEQMLRGDTSLALVKDQLLPRSELTVSELDKVLKTRFIGKRLVMTVSKNGAYSDRLGDLRLQDSPLSNLAANTTPGVLSEATLLDLQAFIRLWRKLGWSIETTDAAICSLAKRSRSRTTSQDPNFNYILDGGLLEKLAAVKELSELSSIFIEELLPLWGPMDAHSSASLYTRLFLRPQLLQRFPRLALNTAGSTLPEAKLGDNLEPLLRAFRLTSQDGDAVLSLSKLDLASSWSLENVAKIYGHVKLSEILDLSMQDYVQWYESCSSRLDPLLDPSSTVLVVRTWLEVAACLPGDKSLMEVIRTSGQSTEPSAEDLIFVNQIVKGLSAIDARLAPITVSSDPVADAQTFTTNQLVSWISEYFDAATTDRVVQLIEGTASQDYKLSPPSEEEIPSSLSNKLVRVDKSCLRLCGAFTDGEVQIAHGLRPNDKSWQTSVTKYADAMQDVMHLLAATTSQSTDTLMTRFGQSTTTVLDVTQREHAQVARRQAALIGLVPSTKARLIQELLGTALAARFPGQQLSTLLHLHRGATDSAGNSSAALSSLLVKALAGDQQSTPVSNAWIFPSSTAEYSFISDSASSPMHILQQQLEFRAISQRKWSTPSISLKQDQAYHVKLNSEKDDIRRLHYSTPQDGVQKFTKPFMCPASGVEAVTAILHQLQQSLLAANTFGFDDEEISHHTRTGVDFARIDLTQILKLASYIQCRKQLQGHSSRSLVAYLSSVEARAVDVKGSLESLVTKTAELMGASESEVRAYIAGKWQASDPQELASSLLNTSQLHEMSQAVDLGQSLGVSVAVLFRFAKMPQVPTWNEDFDTLLSLRQALATIASQKADNDGSSAIQQQRQNILQRYLLSTSFFQDDLKIKTVDELFAYFLIDLKMGPQLKTSRIGQAIATVQLFVQRCLLGLEKPNKVRTTAIDQTRWSWMQKYTLWAANRKVFLYPENWADPALRDNKSQPFDQLASTMLQSNLTVDSVNQMVREYIYTVHDIADLEVQSYLWEAVKGFRGRYHFFARTRTAPFTFYYRQLHVVGASLASIQWHWQPWTKMDLDFPAYEMNADGSTLEKPGTYLLPALVNERVFLFIPDIVKKTTDAPKKANTAYKTLVEQTSEEQKPYEYWEIRMAWTELRSGKWSKKQITETGIECRPPVDDKGKVLSPLASIERFRFRLSTRLVETQSNLCINVERWQNVTAAPDNADIVAVGAFELQGSRLRPVTELSGNVSRVANIQTNFSRFSHATTAKSDVALQKETEAYRVGPNAADMRPLLALPAVKADDPSHKLTWLLAFDDSQYAGASGLIVERHFQSKVESFFGFPSLASDGGINKSVKTTPNCDLITYDSARVLMETAASTDGLDRIFSKLEDVPQDQSDLAFGKTGKKFHELAKPYSIYNWELGFHIVALLVERLLSTQQYDLALQLARQVFDPTRDDLTAQKRRAQQLQDSKTVDVEALKPLSRLDRCWRFPPFKSTQLRTQGSVKDIIERLAPGESSTEISQWAENAFSPHSVARQRPSVYMKRFVRKYIEVLIGSGDQYFRQPSLEAIPLALQRYLEASQLFGPAPQSTRRPTKSVTKTYAQITDLVNEFTNASLDMELEFPFYVNPASRQGPSIGKTMDRTLGFVTTTYFSIPANPELKALRDLLDLRFFNLRNGLDINGNPRSLPLFDPPLDVGQLVTGVASGFSPTNILASVTGPMPNYRSTYLLQKAIELCGELKSMADAFLSIKEKRDTEAMSILRARQDINMQNLSAEIRQMQIVESQKALESMQYTRKSQVSRLKYYLRLIGESEDVIPTPTEEWRELAQSIEAPTKDDLKMSSQEFLEMSKTEVAAGLISSAATTENIASGLLALPELTAQAQPMGVGLSTQVGVKGIAQALMCKAAVVRAEAQQATDTATRAGRTAQLVRQLQDRRLQANQIGYDISGNDKQIAAQKISIQRAQAELKLQKQQAADAAETEEYLRTKYTSEELYSWLESSVRRLLYETYTAAFDMAKVAERAFGFEYGKSRAPQFLANAYWNDTHNGLLAAESLHLALRRIESFYINNQTHDYELSKAISLRQINPLALLSLRTTGVAEFTIPEVLFDHDFPGHYCRRIKRVSLTLPCVVGPYTTISCEARLVEHRYRLKPGSTSSPLEYYNEDNGGDAGGDDRFHRDRIPVTAIALSSGQQDNGAFELSFQDERYSPFEGAGVISRWRIELPSPYRQFNYETVSDVVFMMHYTALDGGMAWKNCAAKAVRAKRAEEQSRATDEGLVAMIDLRNEASQAWSGLMTEVGASDGGGVAPRSTLTLPRLSTVLPYWTSRQQVSIRRLWLVADTGGGGASKDAWLRDANANTSLLGVELKTTKDISIGGLAVLASQAGIVVDPKVQDGPVQLTVPKKSLSNCWVLFEYTVSENARI